MKRGLGAVAALVILLCGGPPALAQGLTGDWEDARTDLTSKGFSLRSDITGATRTARLKALRPMPAAGSMSS